PVGDPRGCSMRSIGLSRTGCAPTMLRALAGAHPVGDPRGCSMRSIGLSRTGCAPATCMLLQEPTLWATRADVPCEAWAFAHRVRSYNSARSCRSPPYGRTARMFHAKHRTIAHRVRSYTEELCRVRYLPLEAVGEDRVASHHQARRRVLRDQH